MVTIFPALARNSNSVMLFHSPKWGVAWQYRDFLGFWIDEGKVVLI